MITLSLTNCSEKRFYSENISFSESVLISKTLAKTSYSLEATNDFEEVFLRYRAIDLPFGENVYRDRVLKFSMKNHQAYIVTD